MNETLKPLILIVEDDKQLSRINREALELEECAVRCAFSLSEARALLSKCEPDVILLDIKLPDGDGIDFCREIRSSTTVHIIFLTSVTESAAELEGLRAGGNDYLRKPYSIELLCERVKNAATLKSKPPQSIRRGPLTLDLIARRAYINGEDLCLQQKEFYLLQFLMHSEGQPMSAERIYEKVWGQPLVKDKNALQKAVSIVRKKIAPSGYAINAIYGKGYVFEQA